MGFDCPSLAPSDSLKRLLNRPLRRPLRPLGGSFFEYLPPIFLIVLVHILPQFIHLFRRQYALQQYPQHRPQYGDFLQQNSFTGCQSEWFARFGQGQIAAPFTHFFASLLGLSFDLLVLVPIDSKANDMLFHRFNPLVNACKRNFAPSSRQDRSSL